MSNGVRSFQDKVPQLGKRVYIDPQAAVIGEVSLDDDVSVWPMAVIRGDVNFIKIGKACSIQDAAILHVTHAGPYTLAGLPLVIGQGVTVGHQAVLHGCTVDDYSLIGMGALVLDAVHIQHHVMVGAGSVVPPGKILESGHLYLGNPAKKLRQLSPQEIERLEYSAKHYVRLKDNYLKSLS